ncbi:MAG: serine protease [Staphylococcus equorum]|nr:serine protease [Staphylococcus equorum]
MFTRKMIGSIAFSLVMLFAIAPFSSFAATDTQNNDTTTQPTQTQQNDNTTNNQSSEVMPRVILPDEDRTQIENTTTGHYQSVGYMNMGSNIATGVVIDKNTVLTNKHVANLSNGDMTFAPAAKNEGSFPYGEFTEKDVQAYPGQEDLVLVHFNTNDKGQSVGDVVQPATIQDASSVSKGDPVTVTGYPGDKSLATMWESKGEVLTNNGTQLTYGASTFGGNSGSPIFNANNEVVGLHYGGVEGESNNGVALTGDVLDFINENKK